MNVTATNEMVPALLTPFEENGRVNTPVLRQMVGHMLDLGAGGFYVCGSSGEGLSLSADERKEIVETVKDEAGGRAAIIVNISHMEFKVVLDLAKHAAENGADAVSTLPPLYYPVSDDEVMRYYLSICDQAGLPVAIYNIPMLSGKFLNESMVEQLLEHPRFMGIKHCSEDTSLLIAFKRMGGDRLTIWSARDAFFAGALAMGADGAIGTSLNLNADFYVEIARAFRAGDVERAQAIQSDYNVLLEELYRLGGYRSIKRCFTLMGMDAGKCRPPFAPLGPDADEYLRPMLQRFAAMRLKWGLPTKAAHESVRK